MAGLRTAIIEATVPNSNGTVDYTSSSISTWSTSGLAIVFVTGDTASLTLGGFLSYGVVSFSGSQCCTSINSIDGMTTVPENKDATVNDKVAVILDNSSGAGFASWVRGTFSAALTNGVRINWEDTSGVGSRVFKVVILLVDGLTSAAAVSDFTSSVGFTANAVLSLSHDAASSPVAWAPTSRNGQAVCPGMGAGLNTSGLPQGSVMVVSDRLTDPLVSRGARRTAAFSTSSQGTTESIGTITAYNASGLAVTGTAAAIGAQMVGPNGVSDFCYALETLDGSTGAKSFTGLGKNCSAIIGFVCGVTTSNSFEADSSALSTFAYFVTDGTTTKSFGFAQKHNGSLISGGNPTDTYSSYSSSGITMVDHLNATAFQATVSSITATGLDLSVTTGLSGTMMLFGFTRSLDILLGADTERISDGHFLNLISRLILSETVQVSDGLGGLELADGLTALQDTGSVFQGGAHKGTVMQGGAVAGVVEG